MLRFFQKSYLSQYTVLLLITSVFWIPSFILKDTYQGSTTTVFDITSWLFMNNVFVMNGVALIVTLFLGLLIKNVAGEFDFSSKLSTTGMLLFLVFSSALSSFTVFSPFIIVNILLLFFIRNLFLIPTTENTVPLVFNTGLILGVASLFFLPTVFLFLTIWVALIIHRSNEWRNYVVSITGILMPHIFIWTWYFWNDNLGLYWKTWTDLIHIYPGHITYDVFFDLIIGIIFILLFAIAVLRTSAQLSEKNIIPRRNQLITFYYFLFIFLIILLFSIDLHPLLMIGIPGTLILANFLQILKQNKLANIVFMIILIFIFTNQYFRLFYPLLNLEG